jgi:hypothetical protein
MSINTCLTIHIIEIYFTEGLNGENEKLNILNTKNVVITTKLDMSKLHPPIQYPPSPEPNHHEPPTSSEMATLEQRSMFYYT